MSRISPRLARLLHRPAPPRRPETLGGRATVPPATPAKVPDWYRPTWAEKAAAEDAARRSTPLPPPDPAPHLSWWERRLLEDAARRAAEMEAAAERARNPAPPVDRLADTAAWLARVTRDTRRDP